MQEVFDFFKNLFSNDDFRSFWSYGDWTSFHSWFYMIGDFLLWSAYMVIPMFIVSYALKNGKTIKDNKLYYLFALFISLCAMTFFVDALMFWSPMYRLDALTRFIAGAASWVMVFYVMRNVSKAFSIRTGDEMQEEIDQRIGVEKELKQKNEQLQEAERIAKIGYIKWDVINEQVEFSDAVPDLLEVSRDRVINYQNLFDIIHPDDVKQLEKVIDTIFIRKFFPNFYCRIIVPNGDVKHLLVVGQVLLSSGGSISVVKGTIQDATEQRLYIQKIQAQNQTLKDIAWIQSHKVRAPVASILGLIQLFNKDNLTDPTNVEVLDGITEAANTLDDVIKEINAKTEEDGGSDKTDAEPK